MKNALQGALPSSLFSSDATNYRHFLVRDTSYTHKWILIPLKTRLNEKSEREREREKEEERHSVQGFITWHFLQQANAQKLKFKNCSAVSRWLSSRPATRDRFEEPNNFFLFSSCHPLLRRGRALQVKLESHIKFALQCCCTSPGRHPVTTVLTLNRHHAVDRRALVAALVLLFNCDNSSNNIAPLSFSFHHSFNCQLEAINWQLSCSFLFSCTVSITQHCSAEENSVTITCQCAESVASDNYGSFEMWS